MDVDAALYPEAAEQSARTDRLHALAQLAEHLRQAPEVGTEDAQGEGALRSWHCALRAVYDAIDREAAKD